MSRNMSEPHCESIPSVDAVFVVFPRSCVRGLVEFSRLARSATPSPLRMLGVV